MRLVSKIFSSISVTKEEREFNAQVRKDGLEIAVNRCIQEINQAIPSKELAIKFVLQELDFAQKEEILPLNFILNSGFHQLEYQDALNRFKESESELIKIQTISDNFLKNIKNDKEIIYTLTKIIETIMDKWEIGKYAPAREESQEITEEISEPKVEYNKEEDIIIENIEEPKPIQYDSDRVNHLMEEYSDIIGDIITGTANPTEEKRIEEFKEHISSASIEGHSDHAVVLSCFYHHKEPYDTLLPIKTNQMSSNSLNFFKSILKGFAKQGFSEPFLEYEEENREDIYNLLQCELPIK
jgi:hypothetical protein